MPLLSRVSVLPFFARVGERAARFGTGTSRKAQLIAAVLLPFFLVAAMATATVVHQVVMDLMPFGFLATDFIRFLLGTAILLATFAFAFAWVKSGGFQLFA